MNDSQEYVHVLFRQLSYSLNCQDDEDTAN